MGSHQIFGIVGGGFALLGFVAYIVDLLRLKDEGRSTKATWIIWWVNTLVLVVSYYFAGAGDTIYLPIGFLIGNTLIVVFALRFMKSEFTVLDKLCFTGAIVSLLLWAATYSPLSTVVVNRIIGWIGAAPTIRKTFAHPGGENSLAWGFFFVGTVVSLFAIEDWGKFVEPWFVLNTGAINGLIFFLSVRGRRTDHKSSENK